MGTRGTAQADSSLMWTVVIPQSPLPSLLQPPVLSICLLPPELLSAVHSAFTHLPDHPPASHPNSSSSPSKLRTKISRNPSMLVGQEDSREPWGRQEAGDLQLETRCCWAAENISFRGNGNKDSAERQSWAAVHRTPRAVPAVAPPHLGSSVLPLTKDRGRWQWALSLPHCTEQHALSCALCSVPTHSLLLFFISVSLGKQYTNGSLRHGMAHSSGLYLTTFCV